MSLQNFFKKRNKYVFGTTSIMKSLASMKLDSRVSPGVGSNIRVVKAKIIFNMVLLCIDFVIIMKQNLQHIKNIYLIIILYHIIMIWYNFIKVTLEYTHTYIQLQYYVTAHRHIKIWIIIRLQKISCYDTEIIIGFYYSTSTNQDKITYIELLKQSIFNKNLLKRDFLAFLFP